jgi:XTP/dITP diphosphohydrolase
VPARIVLLVTSPRLPAGLLTAAAWDLVRTHKVFASAATGQSEALSTVGVDVVITDRGVDDLLAAAATGGAAVWLSAAGGDERLARELGLRLAREPQLAELELMYGSWDPSGARLLDAVTVMDRLVSPGGDPWKRGQTHRSLAKYLLEEAYEAVDAIEAGDHAALRDELGDVLLQVLLHARMAEELPDGEAWSVDDVAGDFVAKMIRRNPHVFADGTAQSIEEITAEWERIKKAEKAGRSAMDSIALAQPALSLATKVQYRSSPMASEKAASATPDPDVVDAIGERLWSLVAEARAAGVDAETALRKVTLAKMDAFREAEEL